MSFEIRIVIAGNFAVTLEACDPSAISTVDHHTIKFGGHGEKGIGVNVFCQLTFERQFSFFENVEKCLFNVDVRPEIRCAAKL